MIESDKNKIQRFGERLPVNLIEHWNEIIEIINKETQINEMMESETQMNVFYLETKLRKTFLNVLILNEWIKDSKINSKTGFNNMVNYITDNIRNYDS